MQPQLFLSSAPPRAEALVPVTNCQFVKPKGGLWTSTYDAKECASGWVAWCEHEAPAYLVGRRWFLLTPAADARVLIINTVADMDALYRCYADRVTGLSFVSMLDFEAMARDFDAMRVTEAGQWATRLTYPQNLYGWDCESTVWFRWKFVRVQEIRARRS